MRFNWTTLWVKDMEKSLAFYQEVVGLSLKRRQMAGPVMELAFLGDGETQIELISDCTRGAVSPSRDISIGFEAESLDQLTRVLAERDIPIHSGPFSPNPSIRYLFVQDPDGWMVQFAEHPAAPGEPQRG